MRLCFVCLFCTNFAFWPFAEPGYSIKKIKEKSYLSMEFLLVNESIFPRHLKLNLSVDNYAGLLLYSIDANKNQLVVGMLGSGMNLLVQVMGGKEEKISLKRLCGCAPCLFIHLLLEIGMRNSTFWVKCNGGSESVVSFNPSNRTLAEGYPTLKQKQGNRSSSANSADLYFIGYPNNIDSEQMQGCIFNIEYNGQSIINNMSIVGKGITKGCRKTCSSEICNGGVCLDTYVEEPICNCTTAFGNGQYCTDVSRIVNQRYTKTFNKFVGIKLSWKSSGTILWQMGNNITQLTVTVTVDYWRRQLLTLKYSQRNHLGKETLLADYVRNESYVLILSQYKTIPHKKVNNVTVIYANYSALKDADVNIDYMILSSCDGVIDVAVLETEDAIQWNRLELNEIDSSPYNCSDTKQSADTNQSNSGRPGWVIPVSVLAVIAVIIGIIIIIIWLVRKHGNNQPPGEQERNGEYKLCKQNYRSKTDDRPSCSTMGNPLYKQKNDELSTDNELLLNMVENHLDTEKNNELITNKQQSNNEANDHLENNPKDEEPIVLHWKEVSMICLKIPIVNENDIQNAVAQIQQNVRCLKRMIFICHMPDSLHYIPSCMEAKRLFIEEKENNEYVVYPKDELNDTMNMVKRFRDWICKDSSGDKICMNKPSNDEKWEMFSTIQVTVSHGPDKDIFHVLVKDDVSTVERQETLKKFVQLKQRMIVEKFIKSHNSETEKLKEHETQYKDEFNKLIMFHLPMVKFTYPQEHQFRNIEVTIEVPSKVEYVSNIEDYVEFMNDVLSHCDIFEKVIILQQFFKQQTDNQTDNGTCVVLYKDKNYGESKTVRDISAYVSKVHLDANIELLNERNQNYMLKDMSVPKSRDFLQYVIVDEIAK